jgi:hypothetical protein
MILHPAVVVHGLDHARAALRPGRAITLLSAPGAARFAGCLWWRGLIGQARAEFPGVPATDVLDCADSPGSAMAALRVGQGCLVLDPACPAFAAVAAAAATLGAVVLPTRPPALDLAGPGAERLLAGLLRGDSASPLV